MKSINTAGSTARFAIVGVIVLLMLIPLAMVDGVSSDRQQYFERTLDDVAGAWGGEQIFDGPFLLVPQEPAIGGVELVDGVPVQVPRRAARMVAPAVLNVNVRISHQMRRRALYEVPVYTAVLTVSGEFPPLDGRAGISDDVSLNTDSARLVVGIGHTRAITRATTVRLGDIDRQFESGTHRLWGRSGIHAVAVDYDGTRPQPFSFEIELNGTRSLGLAPVGGASTIGMESTWPHPSFSGRFLPAEYQIRDDGFTALWRVHELARDLPANWQVDGEVTGPDRSLASVQLFQPLAGYRVVDRAIKYGVLFIVLTFLAFVCFELTLGLRFHPVQYGVAGIALVLFYLALLSLSEHLPFGAAYLASTVLLTGLISGYVRSITGRPTVTVWTALVTGTLYGVLYVLLMLETYALLVGTGVLFVGLGALMFSTRSLTVDAAAEPRSVGDEN
jgi:inner membrane protein